MVSRSAPLRALASPVRQELLDLLARSGPASVADLGRLLGRPADGLYYHLRALERAGLVRSADSRGRAGRSETVYRSTLREPAVRHDPSPGGNSPLVTAIVASMLRLGARDFRRAAANRDVRAFGPARELWALRVTGWLTPSELRDVNRRVSALRDSVGSPGPGRRLYAVTVLLTPLEHRARRKQRSPIRSRPPSRRRLR